MTDNDEQDHLRASDADREAVAEQLREGLAEGRLDVDEYGQRLDQAFEARTLGELEPLTADLPPVPAVRDEADVVPSAPAARKGDGWVKEWRDWLGVAIILNAIWAITSVASGEPVFYWPMFPLGIWGAVIVASLLWDDDEDDEG